MPRDLATLFAGVAAEQGKLSLENLPMGCGIKVDPKVEPWLDLDKTHLNIGARTPRGILY